MAGEVKLPFDCGVPSDHSLIRPIRKIDIACDLNPVADLIELCFPSHLDPDGKTDVNEMRKASRDMRLMD